MDDDAARAAGGSPRRRTLLVGGALTTVAVAVGAGVLAFGGGAARPTASVTAAVPTTVPVTQSPTVPVCGVPSPQQVTDDGVDAEELGGLRRVADDVATVEDGVVLTLRVLDGRAYVLEWDRGSTYTVTAYDLASGDRVRTTDVELAWAGDTETFSTDSFEVDPDGSFYLLDTLEQRRDLVKVAPDGERVWTTALPAGDQTEGGLLDLYGTVRWEDGGRTVVGVQESGAVLHEVTTDGRYEGTVPFEGALVGQLPDGRAVLERTTSAGTQRSADLVAVDAQGEESLHLGATWTGGRPFGVGRAPWLEGTGLSTGPDGEGIVVATDGVGFDAYGDDGVFRGVWPDARRDLAQPFTLGERTPVLRDGADGDAPYVVLATGPDGTLGLVEVAADRMAYELTAPVKYNAGNEDLVTGLGLGAGLVTDAPYGVFRDGQEPQVRAVVDDAWEPAAATYRLRYQVRGDPRVPDPVVGEEHVVDLPVGEDLALDLPPARPGVYEVDAALVERDTGRAVSGTCLRYTVAGPDSALDPAALAPGADWGGAAPLRGVQLADQLGVGSHRVQLDLGALVPDPEGTPGPDGIVWDALPGPGDDGDGDGDGSAGDGGGDGAAHDPFADLVAASEEAQRTGVVLAVQVGSGGEAETAAVAAGTWEGWVREIVAGLRERAPLLHVWEPWNEPNNTGFADAAAYVEQVAEPFAAAVRAVDPGAVVVGGNTLGVVPDWWADLVAAGGCASLDVVAVHPYTGHNRSWEEEGFSADGAEMDRLREAVAPCGDVPVWDTESGWWSDGVANFWAGGSDVVRKLLWYGTEDVPEWTVFFSEGGFGEEGNSWSLLQYGAYVKPAGAAFAATAPLLDRYGAPSLVATGTPGVLAARAQAADGSGLLVVWGDDLSTTVRLTAAGDAPVRAVQRDPYGAERELVVEPGGTGGTGGTDVAVTGAPALLLLPAGAQVDVGPVEAFGPDLLAGRPVTVTSTHDDAGPAEQITAGTFDVRDPWRSGRLADDEVDARPTVMVETDGPQVIDRVAVATAGIRCCTAGLRDYTVSVRGTDGAWHEVARVEDQFWDRVALLRFDPVEATAVRVEVPTTTERDVPVLAVNYTGIVGGLHPDFVPLETESAWIVAVSAVQAWGPG